MVKESKQDIIKKFARFEGDTGSSDVQIAKLTHEIEYLTEHLKEHKKDHSTRRGLLAKVHRRRKLLNYLKRKDEKSYQNILKQLKIRHR